jgi:tRNA(adenine34) deaminase
MSAAVDQARRAASLGEIPVGAVVVESDRIVAQAHNETEKLCDPTAHAEILALRRAAGMLGDWRLREVTLYVTLEPCTMCIGAMVLARLKTLVFGAVDPVQGAVGSIYDLSRMQALPHQIETVGGVLADESSALLREFFEQMRKRP